MSNRNQSQLFQSALEKAHETNGKIKLISWANKKISSVPQTNANWNNIAKMLRDFIEESDTAVTLQVIHSGLITEEYFAVWSKSTDSIVDVTNSRELSTMDSLEFSDKSTFHFEKPSSGKPYVMVDLKKPNQHWAIRSLFWIRDHILSGLILLIIGFLLGKYF